MFTVCSVKMDFRLILVPEYGAKTNSFMTFLKFPPYGQWRHIFCLRAYDKTTSFHTPHYIEAG